MGAGALESRKGSLEGGLGGNSSWQRKVMEPQCWERIKTMLGRGRGQCRSQERLRPFAVRINVYPFYSPQLLALVFICLIKLIGTFPGWELPAPGATEGSEVLYTDLTNFL